MKYYISTIDPKAHELARQYDLGLEIAEFCTAWNMDERFTKTDESVRYKIDGFSKLVLHAPFNELFPCAIDPKARGLAADRYRQAISLAKRYGAQKIIIHGGYHPRMYYPNWYTKQSGLFWKEFMKEDPGMQIVLENVHEEQPDMILDIVKRVNSPKFQMCLDVGHVNACSKMSAIEWLESCAPYISHFHIHNNDTTWDTHSQLDCGTIPMQELLRRAEELCPEATCTLELVNAEPSVRWLKDHEMIG